MMKKIAILGAGNGGFAFSGHLALKGFEVRLYEDPKFGKNIEEVKVKGGIEVSGVIKGFGKVALASTDIASVLAGVKVVMIPVPAFAQMAIFEAALPYLEDGQIVVFWPGNFGEILAKKIMKEKGVVVHCGTAILNAGWIEYTKGDFEFYWHGMTESVCRVLEKVDEERIAVGKALGLELKSTLDILKRFYPTEKGETFYEFVTHSRAHGGRGSSAPKSLKDRYISEDVPAGLVFTSSLGKISNVPTPTIDSLIWLASTLNKEDYRKTGRDLDYLGFSGMSKEEIINYVNTGK